VTIGGKKKTNNIATAMTSSSSTSSSLKGNKNSQLFLSGEPDSKLKQKREKSLLLFPAEKKSTNELLTLSDGGNVNKSAIKIEVLDGDQRRRTEYTKEGTVAKKAEENGIIQVREKIQAVQITQEDEDDELPPLFVANDNQEENDEPPPLNFTDITQIPPLQNVTSHINPKSDQLEEEPPSLMEEMMKQATKARVANEKMKNEMERKHAKSASTFDGMKKGFLTSSTSTKKKKKINTSFRKGFLNNTTTSDARTKQGKNTTKEQQEDDEIFELDSMGNLIKSSPSTQKKKVDQAIPTVRPSNTMKKDPLIFEEIQDAMKNAPSFDINNASGSWATPDLMEKISKNPRLLAGLSNPKFAAALEALQKNPRMAMKKFQNHPEIMDYLHEFCGVLGEHFTKLGEEQEKEKKTQTQQTTQKKKIEPTSTTSISSRSKKNIGPIAEKVLKKHATNQTTRQQQVGGTNNANNNMARKDKEKVDSILANRELVDLLMDAEFQNIMQECSVPGRMQMYMQHPEHGPKLRKLLQAGLLQVSC